MGGGGGFTIKGISQFTDDVRLIFLLERGIMAQKHKIGVISAKMYVTFGEHYGEHRFLTIIWGGAPL